MKRRRLSQELCFSQPLNHLRKWGQAVLARMHSLQQSSTEAWSLSPRAVDGVVWEGNDDATPDIDSQPNVTIEGVVQLNHDTPLPLVDCAVSPPPTHMIEQWQESLMYAWPIFEAYFPTTDLRLRSVPAAPSINWSRDGAPAYTEWQYLASDQRAAYLTEQARRHMIHISENERQVQFRHLNGDTVWLILAQRLFTTMEQSCNTQLRDQASSRNYQRLQSGYSPLERGQLAHSTPIENLERILAQGLLCGECIGADAVPDCFPFNVDFTEITEMMEIMAEQDSLLDSFRAKRDSLFNINPQSVIVTVQPGAHNSGIDEPRPVDVASNHRLVFGSVSATDINGIIVNTSDDQALLDRVVNIVSTSGLYVPVYDENGVHVRKR